jgi:hypothetical protein
MLMWTSCGPQLCPRSAQQPTSPPSSYGSHADGECRAGCTDWEAAACAATEGNGPNHLACLEYLLDIDDVIDGALRKSDRLMRSAVKNPENTESLKILLKAGVAWARKVAHMAICYGNAKGLRVALEHGEPECWDMCMESAIPFVECMQVLYEKGYEERRSQKPEKDPALLAIREARLDSLKLVMAQTLEPPWPELIDCNLAVRGGVAMLKYVHGVLGGVVNTDTMVVAALNNNLEALKYLRSCGVPWDVRVLLAAIDADSLECLKYALENGCPYDIEIKFVKKRESFKGTRSAALVKYVFEQMEPIWGDVVLKCTFTGGVPRRSRKRLRSRVAI